MPVAIARKRQQEYDASLINVLSIFDTISKFDMKLKY